ncbi:MAG TPA: DUF4432 domain-containing protein [Firmicutes bacterium]|nr:DUF4432 domain-containing protein [Bacillota bacterium]HBX25302.1 DUF4432 domain-containing protein [Bacillota bacterium]
MDFSYVGDISSIYGVRKYSLLEGKAKGMEFFHVKNGLGLEMDISLDRNADISSLSYKGVNLSFSSCCGNVSPFYFNKNKDEFLKSFNAGFLTTCGLTYFGSPCMDNNEELGLHGTIANTPVSSSSYEYNDKGILVKTITRDENIFSHKLVLNRSISISNSDNVFYLNDLVSNNGDQITPLMVLYHMNIGYPLLDENALLYINYESIKPRNEHSKLNISSFDKMSKPIKNFQEMCYYFLMKENPFALVFNPKLNIGLLISYDKTNLDSFVEWKMMGYRDYALGLEPGNAYPEGRNEARKNKSLKFIKPNETKSFSLRVRIFQGHEEFLKIKEGELGF